VSAAARRLTYCGVPGVTAPHLVRPILVSSGWRASANAGLPAYAVRQLERGIGPGQSAAAAVWAALALPTRSAIQGAVWQGAYAMFARYWKALSREPLAHFLALAALLFVAYELLAPSEREPIVIVQANIDELVRQQEELLARPLTEDERRAVVETAIDDEVLLREHTDAAWTGTR
jgi:hypothetical protein